MILRLLGIFVFLIIGFMVWSILKLIFQLGRTSGELGKKFEEMQKDKSGRNSGRKGKVIELDRDQYKVE
ncbi:MAG TPA: hypothetical protein P5120_04190 [Spirochaetota bacterium]|nr:hypothetical protein [Spirochaetota bacterium]HPF06043.1 hypothetical protein [Spirochaetota bacterium]HPJ42403.1 hypothetical protein [Spirochaetota bacterium]HPR39004.1 hypothetical protein [Spirochaetota bacterium]HRX46696.1 hypothetical protein [Spirochaetota bacterium]